MEQAASMARLISPKRTKNVNGLPVAVMQWELTLVEHESKFTEVEPDSAKTAVMRAVLPKDMLERFLDGPFNYEELRIRVAAYVDRRRTKESNPWTLCSSTNLLGMMRTSMQCNAVSIVDSARSQSKSPTMTASPQPSSC